MRYVTSAEMKEIDRNAIEDCGIPASHLMEAAGRAVANEAMVLVPKGRSAVFCGYGNNGGDGLVAARYLLKSGFKVKVFFAGKAKSLTRETNANLEKLLSLGIHPEFISTKEDIVRVFRSVKADIVIDAIFGTGFKGALDNFYIRLIEEMNSLGVPIVSADIPSGFDADTGLPLPIAVKAASTVTFGYPKVGFKSSEADGYIGRLVVADIGFPDASQEKTRAKEKTIRLRKGRSGVIKEGHPWIFRNQMQKTAQGIKAGDIVAVQTAEGKLIGRGYFNPKSGISIRLLTFGEEKVGRAMFAMKIKAAFEKRASLKKTTNAFRVIFSEADSLPGLIADIYAGTLVFQVLTLGMEKFKPVIVEAFREVISPEFIYEKSVSEFRKLEGLKDAEGWHGSQGNAIVEIVEGRAKFLVDIKEGHKTGFYLDQRKSRLGLEGFCNDKSVLDLFCYTGGFSISAGLYGAKDVTGVDIKEGWLKLARENAAINSLGDKSTFLKGDAFAVLNDLFSSGRKFDAIIVDPPSFLKTRESLVAASKGYRELNMLAMKTLSDGGMLATFSCSHNMPNETFSGILKQSALDAGKKISILKRCHQAEDHPIVRAIPETEYLKGYFLKVADV